MAKVLTLYFGGSGQGLDKSTALSEAYKATSGPTVWLPGPGGSDPNVYLKNMGNSTSIGKYYNSDMPKQAAVRATFGQGWNISAYYALWAINKFATVNSGGQLVVNMAGHSRGSVTIIMLLNDIFRTSVGTSAQKFKIKGDGTHSFKSSDNDEDGLKFESWYYKTMEQIYKSRMQSADAGKDAVDFMANLASNQTRMQFNAWLFDPVGGT